MKQEQPKRKATRLQGFDYNSVGAYFITICTENRRQILSHIVGGDVLDAPRIALTSYGKIADRYMRQLDDFYENITVDEYVIMPNHIHLMLSVLENGASRTSPPTTRQHTVVSQFVSTFKRFCNKAYGGNIWQRQFNDHIIRNREDYEKHLTYIVENPFRWRDDELYFEE